MNTPHQKLVWAEGVILHQQHFQQWNQQWQSQLRCLGKAVQPNLWGVKSLTIEQGALAEGCFKIKSCQVLLANGLWIYFHTEQQTPLSCQLKSMDSQQAIYLAIPNNDYVAGVRGYDEPSVQAAWRVGYKEIPDELDSERKHELMLADPNVQLFVGEPTQGNYNYLQIAEVVRDHDGHWQLSESFIPTCLFVNSSRVLLQRLEDLISAINKKTQEVRTQRERTDSTTVIRGEAAQLLMLQQSLARYYARLKHFYALKQLHPERLFAALVEFAAELSVYAGSELSCVEIEYQHDDLSTCFNEIFSVILQLLDNALTPSMATIAFKSDSGTIRVLDKFNLEALKQSAIYLAVKDNRCSTEWHNDFLRQVKIASAAHIDKVISLALPGVKISLAPHLEGELATKPGHHYFALDTTSAAWQQVVTEQSLAVYVSQKFADVNIELVLSE